MWRNDCGLADRFPDVYVKLKEMRFGEGTDIQTEKRDREFWKFVNTQGRLPVSSDKEEKNLYWWCGLVWRNVNGLADVFPEVLAKLKELRWGERTDIKTEKRVKEFWEFVNTHGRLPKCRVKEEKSLYEWCAKVWRNESGLADRCPEVLAKLKEMKWGEGIDIKREKINREFFEFVNTHGRLPKCRVKEEKSLYEWYVKVWRNESGLADRYPEVLAKLKEMRYGEGNGLRTEKRAEEFWKFIEENGRLPKYSVKEEKFLWWWCGRVWRNDCGLADRFPEVYAKIKELKEQK